MLSCTIMRASRVHFIIALQGFLCILTSAGRVFLPPQQCTADSTPNSNELLVGLYKAPDIDCQNTRSIFQHCIVGPVSFISPPCVVHSVSFAYLLRQRIAWSLIGITAKHARQGRCCSPTLPRGSKQFRALGSVSFPHLPQSAIAIRHAGVKVPSSNARKTPCAVAELRQLGNNAAACLSLERLDNGYRRSERVDPELGGAGWLHYEVEIDSDTNAISRRGQSELSTRDCAEPPVRRILYGYQALPRRETAWALTISNKSQYMDFINRPAVNTVSRYLCR